LRPCTGKAASLLKHLDYEAAARCASQVTDGPETPVCVTVGATPPFCHQGQRRPEARRRTSAGEKTTSYTQIRQRPVKRWKPASFKTYVGKVFRHNAPGKRLACWTLPPDERSLCGKTLDSERPQGAGAICMIEVRSNLALEMYDDELVPPRKLIWMTCPTDPGAPKGSAGSSAAVEWMKSKRQQLVAMLLTPRTAQAVDDTDHISVRADDQLRSILRYPRRWKIRQTIRQRVMVVDRKKRYHGSAPQPTVTSPPEVKGQRSDGRRVQGACP